MAKAEPVPVYNMDDVQVKSRIMQKIAILRGLWEIDIKPRKLTRTPKQNNYYWIGVVLPFREWLREAYGDSWITTEQAHEMLKARILSGKDGEVGELPPTTTRLNTQEFAEYVDKAAAWLAEFCSIVVIPSHLFLLKEAQRSNQNERLSRKTN